jgi:hypothetical protein
MLGIKALVVVLLVLAALSILTAIERIFAVYGVARAVPLEEPIPPERLAGREARTVSERD